MQCESWSLGQHGKSHEQEEGVSWWALDSLLEGHHFCFWNTDVLACFQTCGLWGLGSVIMERIWPLVLIPDCAPLIQGLGKII